MKLRKLFGIIAIAVLIKFFLFVFLVFYAPQSRFQNDSADYIESANILSAQGTFARIGTDGVLRYDLHRVPGYSFFLFILHNTLKFPINAVIFVQILLALLAAGVTYKAAVLIDPKIAFLSAVFVLFDPPVSIYSLMILSETLFFFLLACFMFVFVRYLKEGNVFQIIGAALLLVVGTYVRPISYYLGIALAVFILYAGGRVGAFKKAFAHALIFFVVVYSLLGFWEYRNYRLTGSKTFASVIQGNPKAFGLCGSFSRQAALSVKQETRPVIYYLKASSRCILSLLSRPGQFKYFKSVVLSAIGKALAYPWMVFWMLGLVAGAVKAGRNIYYQFVLLIIAYFIVVSIAGAGLLVGERFRVPMVPFIAVLSAYGWSIINVWKKKRV
jgi:hypothetical protein